jgi:2-polyprenyl-3-methyl-5-hydroxy-6-metoxy-1,4-benzoquinol methylase
MNFKLILVWSLIYTQLFLRILYRRVNLLQNKLKQGEKIASHEYFIQRTAARYDMTVGDDEKYYANFYRRFILSEIKNNYNFETLEIHDLACGQARTLISLVNENDLKIASYTGVDFNRAAIRTARQHFCNYNQTKTLIEKPIFVQSDVSNFLDSVADGSLKCIILLEALYMMENPDQVFCKICKKLSKGGLLIITFRSDLYYVHQSLGQGLLENIKVIMNKQQGDILSPGVILNWTNSHNIRSNLVNSFPLKMNRLIGVGVASGIAGDPLAKVVRPSELTNQEQEKLLEVEETYGLRYPDTGRYILTSFSKV